MKITASVPGKVIISGEHSVVYGRTALSSSISLKTVVTLSCCSPANSTMNDCVDVVTFDVPALGILLKLRPDNYTTLCNLKVGYNIETVSSDFELISSHFAVLLQDLEGNCLVAAKLFLYLFGGIFTNNSAVVDNYLNFTVTVTGDLPFSSGLGSSASLAAGLAAVFEGFLSKTTTVDERFLSTVNKWAFLAEQFSHGKASGLDNFTCIYGGLVEVRNGSFAKCPISSLDLEKLTLLFIDSGFPKSTQTTVGIVRSLVDKFPLLAHKIFDAIESVVFDLKDILSLNVAEDAEIERRSADIHRLLSINHCLLKALGVSHAALDELVAMCESRGVGAKLTGGGGGGVVMALIDSKCDSHRLSHLLADLNKHGHKIFITSMTNHGLELFQEN